VIDTIRLADELISEFSKAKTISRDQIKAFYKSHISDLKESSFSWMVYHLCKDKVIQRVGYNTFQLYNNETKRLVFNPTPSDNALNLIELISNKFPLLTFSVWEMWMLNEFVNHQFEKNVIFIDIEKRYEESVFDEIKTELDYPILLKPDEKELDLYSGHITGVIFSLTQEAPKNSSQKTLAPLEKILVDIFANKEIKNILSFGEYTNIFEGAFSKYIIDEKSMFRYARRRRKEQEILEFIKNKTSVQLLTEVFSD
jgi:hypothetical protein